MKKTERFKRWLIRKLGGFVIYPDDEHVIIDHKTVKNDKIEVNCIFSQEQLYEVDAKVLESKAQEKLKDKIADIIMFKDFIKFDKTQDDHGNIEYTATLYLIKPKYMSHKGGKTK